ncbi:MAG: alcohol dehydrogenase catalytic domain-containing protein [Planctomycetota bacterium]|nr:alcohol dehydrogenase catalytic domain-containing protein [Planctomycetota bacterium]
MEQLSAWLTGAETIELREASVPQPGPGELLISIGAAVTCGTDVKVYRRGGHPRMLELPSPFGHEVAGTVIGCGAGVESWQEGERVVVSNSASCGRCDFCARGRENLCTDLVYLNGAFSRYLLVPARFAERAVYRIPQELGFAAAALSEPLACVLHGIEKLDPQPGECGVLFGAGPIGLLFTAVLSKRGLKVLVADPNEPRLELASSLGASAVLVVERGSPAAENALSMSPQAGGFDYAIDASGAPAGWLDALASVRPGGKVSLFGGCAPGTAVELDSHRVHYEELTVMGAYHHRPADFSAALELLAAGELDTDVFLSSERPLEEIEAALGDMIARRAVKVVIRPHPRA